MEPLEVVKDRGAEVGLTRACSPIHQQSGPVRPQLVQSCVSEGRVTCGRPTLQHHLLLERVAIVVLELGLLKGRALLDAGKGEVNGRLEALKVV